jgi:hypothetical protein
LVFSDCLTHDQGLRVGRPPVVVMTEGPDVVLLIEAVPSAFTELDVNVSNSIAAAANAMSFPTCFMCLFS